MKAEENSDNFLPILKVKLHWKHISHFFSIEILPNPPGKAPLITLIIVPMGFLKKLMLTLAMKTGIMPIHKMMTSISTKFKFLRITFT